MFDEYAISQIRGSCDCDGSGRGLVDDENCGRKNRKVFMEISLKLEKFQKILSKKIVQDILQKITENL